MYPTAEQFSDLFDSFFHKTEDKIPMSGVEGLTDQLNGKYSTAEGRELEKSAESNHRPLRPCRLLREGVQ